MIMTAILTLLAGIGVFLVACTMMSNNLEAIGSNRLKAIFSRASGSRLLGVGIGAAGTAAIQSSGATTVMVIGFVNVGILSLQQAATIIYGANIGTTITGQIVALGISGSGAISTTLLFSAFTGIGAFCMVFSRRQKMKTAGGILSGFGMLFIGLNIMSSSMEAFAENENVIRFLAGINNAVLLVILGAVLTAIVQSSSVMTSVAITMVVAGLINIDQGIFLTMGSNVGSCVVAMIAGFSGSVNAKRTALIHFVFNTMGVILFLILSAVLYLGTTGAVTIGSVFQSVFPSAPQIQLAMFHTVFNICTVALMLPFTNQMVAFVVRILPDKPVAAQDTFRMRYLDENMLSTPVVAVGQLKQEILRMADMAINNYYRAIHMIATLDYAEKETFQNREKELNYLNTELVRFIVKLSGKTLGKADRQYLNSTLRTVADLERIGDYAENIVEYAENLSVASERLSPEAVAEVDALKALMEELFLHTIQAYNHGDHEALRLANQVEDRIDDLTERMSENHIRRLTEGKCTPNAGAQYLEMSSNSERVADHLINVAETIRRAA